MAVEQRIKARHGAMLREGQRLQEEMRQLRVRSMGEECSLQEAALKAQESQQEEMLLAEALRTAKAAEVEVQAQLRQEDEAFGNAQVQMRTMEAECHQEEKQLAELQASVRSDYVPAQLFKEEEEFLAHLRQERQEAFEGLLSATREEDEASKSLRDSSPERLRSELSQMQAWADGLRAEFRSADAEMDSMQLQLQHLQNQASAQQEARAQRELDWQRANREVRSRAQQALAEERAAADEEAAQQQEFVSLKQESEEFDEDLAWLEERVQQASEKQMVSVSLEEEQSLLSLRLREEVSEAEEQLASLSFALSKELQKHREANQGLRRMVESEQSQLEGYAMEEKLAEDAWKKERQSLAEEAATVAAELQRLAL
ncbi:unnamed protein product [Durusdinium trenchii]|uniref:Uncharacterized protein n=1 Tax=Durusdinium trenchii TaxID=1381693 RepID=A0ABP0NMQ3_9DINO